MNQRWMAALQAGLLFMSVYANAVIKENIRITVLESETHSVILDDRGVPKNCDQVNFDAYCHNSKTAQVTNTLLVQEGSNPPFRVSCAIESKWSRCIPLPKGESFDARRVKRALEVYYVDDRGKSRKQLYTLVEGDVKTSPPATTVAVAAQPVPAAAAPRQSSAVPAPVPPPVAAREVQGKVKCNFASTPSGAEITLDGKYVGSTPSEIGVSTGSHVVVFSLAGFAEWKRELSVSPGSQLTISAILQKTQP
jgi:hypothetical protein